MEALAPHSMVLTMKVKWLGGEWGIRAGQRSLSSFSGLALLISGINCGVNKLEKKTKQLQQAEWKTNGSPLITEQRGGGQWRLILWNAAFVQGLSNIELHSFVAWSPSLRRWPKIAGKPQTKIYSLKTVITLLEKLILSCAHIRQVLEQSFHNIGFSPYKYIIEWNRIYKCRIETKLVTLTEQTWTKRTHKMKNCGKNPHDQISDKFFTQYYLIYIISTWSVVIDNNNYIPLLKIHSTFAYFAMTSSGLFIFWWFLPSLATPMPIFTDTMATNKTPHLLLPHRSFPLPPPLLATPCLISLLGSWCTSCYITLQ